jgi:hypothetical protein
MSLERILPDPLHQTQSSQLFFLFNNRSLQNLNLIQDLEHGSKPEPKILSAKPNFFHASARTLQRDFLAGVFRSLLMKGAEMELR